MYFKLNIIKSKTKTKKLQIKEIKFINVTKVENNWDWSIFVESIFFLTLTRKVFLINYWIAFTMALLLIRVDFGRLLVLNFVPLVVLGTDDPLVRRAKLCWLFFELLILLLLPFFLPCHCTLLLTFIVPNVIFPCFLSLLLSRLPNFFWYTK